MGVSYRLTQNVPEPSPSSITCRSLRVDSTHIHPYHARCQPSLIDQYDYVTYGKVFKIEAVAAGGGGSREPKVAVMISFGGLLMKLAGDQRCVRVCLVACTLQVFVEDEILPFHYPQNPLHRHVAQIAIDSPIYCFIRRTKGVRP